MLFAGLPGGDMQVNQARHQGMPTTINAGGNWLRLYVWPDCKDRIARDHHFAGSIKLAGWVYHTGIEKMD